MSDWNSYQEERFDLYPPMLSGNASVYPVGSGIVPNPLSKEAYALLLKLFHLSDDMFHYPSITSIPFINDSEVWEELRSKVVDAIVAGKLLDGSIIYTLTQHDPDVEIITLAEAKTRGLPRASSYTTEDDNSIWIVIYIDGTSIAGAVAGSSNSVVNNTGILNWNWYFAQLCCSPTPTTPPIGFNLPPTYHPPTPANNQQRLTYDCQSEQIFFHRGTNHTGFLMDFGLSLGLGLLNLLPVNSQWYESEELKPSFDAVVNQAITDANLGGSTAKEVVFCYNYAGLGHILFQAAGLPAVSLQSELWHLKVTRSNNTTEEIPLEPNHKYGFDNLRFDVSIEGNIFGVSASVQVATAEDSPTKTLKDYDLITSIKLSCKVLPTMPNGLQQLFSNSGSSPAFQLGLSELLVETNVELGACGFIVPHQVVYNAQNDASCFQNSNYQPDNACLITANGNAPYFYRGFSTLLPLAATSVTVNLNCAVARGSGNGVTLRAWAAWGNNVGVEIPGTRVNVTTDLSGLPVDWNYHATPLSVTLGSRPAEGTSFAFGLEIADITTGQSGIRLYDWNI